MQSDKSVITDRNVSVSCLNLRECEITPIWWYICRRCLRRIWGF